MHGVFYAGLSHMVINYLHTFAVWPCACSYPDWVSVLVVVQMCRWLVPISPCTQTPVSLTSMWAQYWTLSIYIGWRTASGYHPVWGVRYQLRVRVRRKGGVNWSNTGWSLLHMHPGSGWVGGVTSGRRRVLCQQLRDMSKELQVISKQIYMYHIYANKTCWIETRGQGPSLIRDYCCIQDMYVAAPASVAYILCAISYCNLVISNFTYVNTKEETKRNRELTINV